LITTRDHLVEIGAGILPWIVSAAPPGRVPLLGLLDKNLELYLPVRDIITAVADPVQLLLPSRPGSIPCYGPLHDRGQVLDCRSAEVIIVRLWVLGGSRMEVPLWEVPGKPVVRAAVIVEVSKDD